MKKNFVVGMDISSFPSLEKQGLTVFKGDYDLLKVLKTHGVTHIRLRLFVDPYSETRESYGGGNNDLETTIKFAKRVQNGGLKLLLDFHYSDFWADPGKQFTPKSWAKFNFIQLVNVIYNYTKQVLLTFKIEGIDIDLIQTGNEITNGMLWPVGKLYEGSNEIEGGFERVAEFLSKAIYASKEIYPLAKNIIHLDRGGDMNLYQTWFKKINQLGVIYDIIGLSYYPYWHGSLEDLKANILQIKKSFSKEVMIMETSYAYTDNIDGSPLVMTTDKLVKKQDWPPYPFTLDGQKAFLSDLLNLAKETEIDGLFYWEPVWLKLPGDTWATKAGREYIKETHKTDGNEWANQALFTQQGEVNPALKLFKDLKGE